MIAAKPANNATRQPNTAIIAIAVGPKLSAVVVVEVDVVVVVVSEAESSKCVCATK